MKPGSRALGIAFSDDPEVSTVAGAVVRVDRVVDGFTFSQCTVGGTDATDSVATLVDEIDRADVRHLLVAGVAPAWFNLLALDRLHAATGLPVLSVSFEASPGLGDALHEQFSGPALADRLAIYESLPSRRAVRLNDERLFVRAVGVAPDRAAEVVRAHTPEGGRPEPLRVARLAARAGREFRASILGGDARTTED